jgi:hypothetical protein
VALISAAPVSRSTIARLPRLPEQLGWVKAPTYRLASRIVKSIGSGVPVREYHELQAASLVLISMPAASVREVVRDLSRSSLVWDHKAVVLFETPYDTTVLQALASRGAACATLHPVGTPEDKRLAVEGGADARRLVRRLLRDESVRLLEIDAGGTAGFLAGIEQLTTSLAPLIASATGRFRKAGLSKSEAESVASLLAGNTMSAYFRAGQRLLRPAKRRRP